MRSAGAGSVMGPTGGNAVEKEANTDGGKGSGNPALGPCWELLNLTWTKDRSTLQMLMSVALKRLICSLLLIVFSVCFGV